MQGEFGKRNRKKDKSEDKLTRSLEFEQTFISD